MKEKQSQKEKEEQAAYMAEMKAREAELSKWTTQQVEQQKADHKRHEEEDKKDAGATSAELDSEWEELKRMEKEIEEETKRVLEDSQKHP